MSEITTDSVQAFWQRNPLCASAVPHELGSREYFTYYDGLREHNESPAFSAQLHEYADFAGKRVLDVGCGNGYVLQRYAEAGAQVDGVDVTDMAIDLCTKRFGFAGVDGTFTRTTAETLPFADDTFDCVCSMGVLHHVPDTTKAISEVARVLKPGGRLIIMMYHRNSWLYRVTFPWVSILTRKSVQQLVNEVDGVGNPKGDVYTRKELEAALPEIRDLEMFSRLLQGWMFLPYIGRVLPDALFRPFQNRLGWFIYAKGWRR